MRFLVVLLFFSVLSNAQDLDFLRSNYAIASADKSVCLSSIELLDKQDLNPVQQAYLGGFQTIMAKHVFNPFSKLSYFNKGKSNIEKAIKRDPKDPEIRFIRFSVQKFAPKILNYYHNLKEDKEFLDTNKQHLISPLVQDQLQKISS